MQHPPLADMRHRIQLGAPVPFNIRGPDDTLLLARGQVIRSESQLNALAERGAVVESDRPSRTRVDVEQALIEELPALWSASMSRVGMALREPGNPEFAQALNEAAEPVLALVERDPDLAIFQVLRQEAAGKNSYGVTHSVHTAIAGRLVAQRMGWDEPSVERVFKAALTMNLAMIELQDQLATQTSPLTDEQRLVIKQHPVRSREMLEASGVSDADWLAAVGDHHETSDGSGYPRGCQDVSELASLLRRVDIYTAKLSPRQTRQALPANQAGRDLFLQDGQHPMAVAVIKEFGIYPPGCLVQLQSGEVGVVIRRGPTANTPLVAALTTPRGEMLSEPERRRTEQRGFGVLAVLPESAVNIRVSPEKLVLLASD